MNISSRLNCLKQFQLKRLSHIIDHSLLYTTSTVYHHHQQQQQQQQQVNENVEENKFSCLLICS